MKSCYEPFSKEEKRRSVASSSMVNIAKLISTEIFSKSILFFNHETDSRVRQAKAFSTNFSIHIVIWTTWTSDRLKIGKYFSKGYLHSKIKIVIPFQKMQKILQLILLKLLDRQFYLKSNFFSFNSFFSKFSKKYAYFVRFPSSVEFLAKMEFFEKKFLRLMFLAKGRK